MVYAGGHRILLLLLGLCAYDGMLYIPVALLWTFKDTMAGWAVGGVIQRLSFRPLSVTLSVYAICLPTQVASFF